LFHRSGRNNAVIVGAVGVRFICSGGYAGDVSPDGSSGVISFGIKGGREDAGDLIDDFFSFHRPCPIEIRLHFSRSPVSASRLNCHPMPMPGLSMP
jgi:hypothetical protein